MSTRPAGVRQRYGFPPTRLVEFPSGDAVLRGRLHEHVGGRPRPAVVMAHGYSATITGMVADRYAEVIAAAGFNVLLYDHRGFGLSGGEPRQVINAWTQARGYHDALTFMVGLRSVDASRLAVWGDSLSGAVALCVAALDDRVRAVVAQVPACGGEIALADPDDSDVQTLREIYRTGGPTGEPRERIGPQAVVSADQLTSPSLLTPITAFRWFVDYGARPGTGWVNRATQEVADTPVGLHPAACAAHLSAASLWAIAVDDEMPGANPAAALRAFEAVSAPKELLHLEGGHFGLLYHPGATFDRASSTEVDFLARQL